MTDQPEAETETEKATVPTALRVVNYADPAQAKIDIAYSIVDLSSAMQEHASLRLHYGIEAAKASRQVNDFKIKLEAAESKVYRQLRDKFTDEGKKVTEAFLEKEVAAHPAIQAIKRAINEAKQIEAIAKATNEAFADRKDMLVQSGAKDRAELEGELRVMGQVDREEMARQTREKLLASRKKFAEVEA